MEIVYRKYEEMIEIFSRKLSGIMKSGINLLKLKRVKAKNGKHKC